LHEKAKALGLTPPDLTFLGECDRIPALLARSGLLVLTSEYEGFPNVILEAMAARLPVITTPAGDASLVVQHNKTGYVVKGEDTQGMAAFMVQLARSPSMRLNLGESGRKRVELEYNYESLAGRLVTVFRTFAAQQRRASLLEMLARDIPARHTEAFSEALLLEGPAA
jgi:glycosyltransferase involved in cell wall biosynthesis